MANKTNRKTEEVVAHVDILPETDEVIGLTDGNTGEEIEFFQIAVVEYANEFYAILQPVEELEGMESDEALVCKIVDDEEGSLFVPEFDEDIVDKVFEEYVKACANQTEE